MHINPTFSKTKLVGFPFQVKQGHGMAVRIEQLSPQSTEAQNYDTNS
jgi:hypothetical protein